ncbi:MAG TPA: hypothetical protein VJA17_03960, partial [Candidatus Omnitrophota bacterium]|nr:hypothetical protein [Candidatus Omnitrophota bacterium]
IMNPALADTEVLRDKNGVPLPVYQQPIQQMQENIPGFFPFIWEFRPIDVRFLLGLDVDPQKEKTNKVSFKNRLDVFDRKARVVTRESEEIALYN